MKQSGQPALVGIIPRKELGPLKAYFQQERGRLDSRFRQIAGPGRRVP